tara:strand:- start:9445 stop:9714 length:270 start_codon:yes stop_codon:yes gene_type:complete
MQYHKKELKKTLDSFYVYYHNIGGTDERFAELHAAASQIIEEAKVEKDLEDIARQLALVSLEMMKSKVLDRDPLTTQKKKLLKYWLKYL